MTATTQWRRPLITAAVVVGAFVAGIHVSWQLTSKATPITFDTKTRVSQWITRARFGPDQQTIVFSAVPRGGNPRRASELSERPVRLPGGGRSHLEPAGRSCTNAAA